jgi:hypothetical protein
MMEASLEQKGIASCVRPGLAIAASQTPNPIITTFHSWTDDLLPRLPLSLGHTTHQIMQDDRRRFQQTKHRLGKIC